MDVVDAFMPDGCHHLVPQMVPHQLTVAGIDGATSPREPEMRHLPGVSVPVMEVDDRWSQPRYHTRRGILHVQRCFDPGLPTIPVPFPRHGGGRRSHLCSACVEAGPAFDPWSMAHDSGHRGQSRRQCRRHRSHPERSKRVPPFFSTCLHVIPTSPNGAFSLGIALKTKVVSVLSSRRVVPTGRLAIREGGGLTCCSPV
jgi:hypothetical protein